MNLCPISHWRHGSTARPRELTRDEKRARYWEIRASHKRVALAKALRPATLDAEEFYREVFAESRQESIAPGLVRNRHDFEPTVRPAPWLGLRSTEASRA